MTNVKKVEGVRRNGQAKVLVKRSKNAGIFQGSYTKGSERPTLMTKTWIYEERLFPYTCIRLHTLAVQSSGTHREW